MTAPKEVRPTGIVPRSGQVPKHLVERWGDSVEQLGFLLLMGPRNDREYTRDARADVASQVYAEFERRDHWEPKEEAGPSDEQSARGDRDTDLGTAGGVDENATKAHLYERAQELDVEGRSTMTKDELVEALEKANDRETRRARG